MADDGRCRCARIKVGMTVTDSRNWNPDCPAHGIKSEWYRSDEQVAKRERDRAHLRDLQQRARDARRKARGS